MMAAILFVATILFVKGENDYSNLRVPLPKPLQRHISAVYDDELYIFGGINGTTDEETNFNTKFYKISLLNKFTLNAENDDITSTLSADDWVELDVSAPAYGDNTNNQFVCDNQCSAVIGKYLYIVGAWEFNSGSTAITDTVYRLDLSQDPPVFAGQNDFPSTQGFGDSPTRGSCVVAVNDILYTANGRSSSGYSTSFTSYNPSTNTQSQLPENSGTSSGGRWYGMCAGNVGQSAVYLLGGRSGQTNVYGSPFVDYFTISSEEWTTPTDDADKDFGVGRVGSRNTACVTSLYSNKVECPGGLPDSDPGTYSYIYDLGSNTGESVDLVQAVVYPGVAQYEFYNTGTVGAYLMIVTGGDTSTDQNAAPTNMTQYSVRYAQITDAPSAAPIQAPTADTTDPTKAPSRSPLCTGCTFPPSTDPTPSPTDAEDPADDSSAIKLCMAIACIMGILSVVIV